MKCKFSELRDQLPFPPPQSLNVEALEISTLRNADPARRGEYHLHFRFLHRLFYSLNPPVLEPPYHVPITRRNLECIWNTTPQKRTSFRNVSHRQIAATEPRQVPSPPSSEQLECRAGPGNYHAMQSHSLWYRCNERIPHCAARGLPRRCNGYTYTIV